MAVFARFTCTVSIRNTARPVMLFYCNHQNILHSPLRFPSHCLSGREAIVLHSHAPRRIFPESRH